MIMSIGGGANRDRVSKFEAKSQFAGSRNC